MGNQVSIISNNASIETSNAAHEITKKDILRVLSVTIDEKPITIKGYEWVSKNKHNIYDLCAYFDEQSFFLYPISKFRDGQKVKIDYKYIFQVEHKSD